MTKATNLIFFALYLLLLSVNADAEIKAKNPTTNQLMHSYLKLNSFRHKVLSQNVANSNTPGYKADEVMMPQKVSDLTENSSRPKKVRLRLTSDKHLRGRNPENGAYNIEKLKDPDEIKPNGNNISMPQQITKISQNQAGYDTVLQSYKNMNQLITVVVGK